MLAHMNFRPRISADLRLMDERIFRPERMGIDTLLAPGGKPLHPRLENSGTLRRRICTVRRPDDDLWNAQHGTIHRPARGWRSAGALSLQGKPCATTTPSGPLGRVAYAAAHIVVDPLAQVDPFWNSQVDWERTLAFRASLWDLGSAWPRPWIRLSAAWASIGQRRSI